MALNVKAALGICVFFIAGLCYVVNRVALPVEAAASPATADASANPNPAAPSGFAARRLARGNPVEMQRAVSREAANKAAAESSPPPTRTITLPPVAKRDATLTPGPVFAMADTPAIPAAGLREPGEGPATPPARALIATRAAEPEPMLEPVRYEIRPADLTVVDSSTPAVAGTSAKTEVAAAGSSYKVRKGDSLGRIARQVYGADDQQHIKMLIEANPKIAKRTNKLFVGEELKVPGVATAAGSDKPRKETAAPAVASASPAKESKSAVQTPKPSEPKPAPAPTPDKVADKSARPGQKTGDKSGAKAGDKPAGTAVAATGKTAAAKPAASGSGTTAKPAGKPTGGALVKVSPGGSGGAKPGRASETAAEQWYTIRGSDSLASIAQSQLKDGRRWRELAELNGLRDPNKLIPGKRIKLPAGTPNQG